MTSNSTAICAYSLAVRAKSKLIGARSFDMPPSSGLLPDDRVGISTVSVGIFIVRLGIAVVRRPKTIFSDSDRQKEDPDRRRAGCN